MGNMNLANLVNSSILCFHKPPTAKVKVEEEDADIIYLLLGDLAAMIWEVSEKNWGGFPKNTLPETDSSPLRIGLLIGK